MGTSALVLMVILVQCARQVREALAVVLDCGLSVLCSNTNNFPKRIMQPYCIQRGALRLLHIEVLLLSDLMYLSSTNLIH